MLAPIFQDPSFNQSWMARNRQLRESVAKGAASTSIQAGNSKTAPDIVKVERGDSVQAGGASESKNNPSGRESEPATSSDSASAKRERSTDLSLDEQRLLSQLQRIDQKVRAHEQAHLNAAQGLAVSGANFEYQLGPDARRYAVGGEVRIDTSREDKPEENIDKGYKIIRTALAPTDPSPQDRSVASYGQQMIYEAQAELMRESYSQNRTSNGGPHEVGGIIDQTI